MNKKYIAIEGPIGVGKSSLTRRLASTFGYQLLLERPDQNPFLERFYNSPKRYALHTQLFFLFQRIEQLRQAEPLFMQGVVADFMLQKDPIFAEIALSEDEYQLYLQAYRNVTRAPTTLDLVVYLQAPVEVLVERVKKRNISFEMNMDKNYLAKLSDAYTDFFHRYTDSPLLIVNAADVNFVDNDQHYQSLVEHLQSIKAGKHFFNPLA